METRHNFTYSSAFPVPTVQRVCSLERIRQLIEYRDRLLHVLHTEELPIFADYRDLHKRAMAATTSRERLQGRYKLQGCFSLMNDFVMYFRLLLGHSGSVDTTATLLFVVLLENRPPNRFVTPDELLEKSKTRFRFPNLAWTLAKVTNFIEDYSFMLLKEGTRVAAQCAVAADRVREIVTLQPGVLVTCLPHLYEETYSEKLTFNHAFNETLKVEGETTIDQLADWAKEEIGGLKKCEKRGDVPHLWSGVLVQFDLVLLGMAKLCVFPNAAILESHHLLVARQALYSFMVFTTLERSEELFFFVDDYIRKKGYMRPLLHLRPPPHEDLYEVSHPINDIGANEAGHIFDEIDRSVSRKTVHKDFLNITRAQIARSPIGYCMMSASHMILREDDHQQTFVEHIYRNLPDLVILKGPYDDRIIVLKELTDRLLPKITDYARKILTENSGSMKKAQFVKEFLRRHRIGLIRYDVWKHLTGDVKLVKKGFNKEEYIECEIVEPAAVVPETPRLAKSLSSVVKSVPLRPLMTPEQLLHTPSAVAAAQLLNEDFVAKLPRAVDNSRSHVVQKILAFREPTPVQVSKCCDILVKKFCYDDRPLIEFMKDAQWTPALTIDYILRTFAAFVDRVDSAIVVESFKLAEIPLSEVVKCGYQRHVPAELLKIFELMYVRMGRVCLRRNQSCQGLKTWVDLRASRMLELAELQPYKIKNRKEVLVPDTRTTCHFRLTAFNLQACMDAIRMHPERFEVNEQMGSFKVKCPNLDLIVRYIEGYAPLGVPPECIAHLCFEHFGTTPGDMLNHYPWYKGSSINVRSFNEDTLKCLVNLCLNESHFGRYVDQRWVRNALTRGERETLIPTYVDSPDRDVTCSNLASAAGFLFAHKANGTKSIPLLALAIYKVPFIVQIEHVEIATGAVYEPDTDSFDLRELCIKRFLQFILPHYKSGICLRQFAAFPQIEQLLKLRANRQNVAKCTAVLGPLVDVRVGNCFELSSDDLASKSVGTVNQEILSNVSQGRIKVEDLCEVREKQSRLLLPGWIDRLVRSLNPDEAELVISADDVLYIQTKGNSTTSKVARQSDLVETETRGSTRSMAVRKKTANTWPHAGHVLESNIRLLLEESPQGIATSEIPKLYFQRFEAQPSFGGNLKSYFKKMQGVEMSKETLEGAVATVVRLSPEATETDEVVLADVSTRQVDMNTQCDNLRHMLGVYQDGVDVNRLRNLYKNMFGSKLVLPSEIVFKEYLGTLDFLEIVQLSYQTMARLKAYAQADDVDKYRFDYRVTELLRTLTHLDKKEIGYELLCKHYQEHYGVPIPCSRQFGRENIFEVLKSSKYIDVRYNTQGTSVLLKLKEEELVQPGTSIDSQAEIRLELNEFIRESGTGVPYKLLESKYEERSQRNGMAFAEFLSKSPKLVVYRDCHQDLIRLKSMQVRPSDEGFAPLVIMLASCSPISMRALLKRAKFDTSQYGYGQAGAFFAALSDVFMCNKDWVRLKKGCTPAFLAMKMRTVLSSLKTDLKADHFGNYFKQQSGIQVNPHFLGFRSWEDLLKASFPDELVVSVYGYVHLLKNRTKPTAKYANPLEPSASVRKRKSEKGGATSADWVSESWATTRSIDSIVSEHVEQESLALPITHQSIWPSQPLPTTPQVSDVTPEVSFDSVDETIYENAVEMLMDMGSVEFPDRFIEEYNERFQPDLPPLDGGTLLLALASRVPMTIQTDGSGGILLLLGGSLDMPLIDENQTDYDPTADVGNRHQTSSVGGGSDCDDESYSTESRPTADCASYTDDGLTSASMSWLGACADGYDGTAKGRDASTSSSIDSMYSTLNHLNGPVQTVVKRLRNVHNIEVALPEIKLYLDEIGAVRKCIEDKLE